MAGPYNTVRSEQRRDYLWGNSSPYFAQNRPVCSGALSVKFAREDSDLPHYMFGVYMKKRKRDKHRTSFTAKGWGQSLKNSDPRLVISQ